MNLYKKYSALLSCKNDIDKAFKLLADCYKSGGKTLVCGNGGSASDSEHIVGELMKGFMSKRPVGACLKDKLISLGFEDADFIAESIQGTLESISLPSQIGVISAFANDVAPELVYAQLVYGYAKEGDVLICLSTSGNSKNALYAAKLAKAVGAKVLSLTGSKESKLSQISDVTIKAPSTQTYEVQEYHLPVYHYLCRELEKEFF